MSIELEPYEPGSDTERSGPNTLLRGLGVLGFVVLLFAVAFLGVKWLASAVNDVIAQPDATTVVPGLEVTIEISAGAPASQIARQLAEAGVVASASEFDRAVRDARASDRLQAGRYELETGMTPEAVLAILIDGPSRETFRLTVIEGLTIGRMLESIEEQTEIPFNELSRVLLDGTVVSSLMPDEPDALQDWEGMLFPDTYEFEVAATAAEILTRMARTMESRVGSIDWGRLEEHDLAPYDAVIIASLIEREALFDEDRPLIASVIYNRLAMDMRLQIDATVVYVLGALPEDGLSLEDLEIESPYNTYVVTGLPPTPIAGVRTTSLRAAANPAETEYLYFLTDEEGKAHFAETFEEFLELQEQYL
ncbi:MAG TPA: endolytic transglycosylase MltG [Acidimicrobiia bacterium]|nr:endolytic transglycosylase MltG [Acidimicrobiia bacterium]